MERSRAVLVGNFVVMVAIVASVVSILDAESTEYTVEGRAPNVKRDWQNVLQRMDSLSDAIFKRSYKYFGTRSISLCKGPGSSHGLGESTKRERITNTFLTLGIQRPVH